MKKAIIAVGLAVAMFLSFSYVYAQQDPGVDPAQQGMQGQGHKGEHPGKMFALDPQQRASLHELHRQFQGETAQLIGEMVTKRLELRLLWTDPKADPEAILAKEKELRDLQNQMRDKVDQYRLEARKLLKPEQIEKFGFLVGMGFGGGFYGHHGFSHHQRACRDTL
jgi:Spy/CpxP family protein refolding chaperone